MLRSFETAVLDQPVDVTAADGQVTGVRRQEVAGGRDRVRPLRAGIQALFRAGQPDQGLLGQVLDQVVVSGSGGERTSHHGRKVRQRVSGLMRRRR